MELLDLLLLDAVCGIVITTVVQMGDAIVTFGVVSLEIVVEMFQEFHDVQKVHSYNDCIAGCDQLAISLCS